MTSSEETLAGSAERDVSDIDFLDDDIQLASFNKTLIEEFRAKSGALDGRYKGVPILLLTTTGAKSGVLRTSPIRWFGHEGKMFVSGNFAGSTRTPSWVFNIRADDRVQVEVENLKYTAKAIELEEVERARVYAVLVNEDPVFAEYEQAADRTIPVFEICRQD